MSDLLRVACVQLNATSVKADNLAKAETLVARAAATGADVVVLPEKWNAWGGPDVIRAAAEPIEGGETFAAMASWARSHGITLVGGSVTELRPDHERLSNSSAVFDPDGALVALYRKIHLFDVEVGGQVYRESETEEPGDELVLAELEGWRAGLTICYDLRFPELYRILALEGAELITLPAAFTLFTGKDHWELLVRARAVENQLYLVAANQWGTHGPGKASYGRSMIVDPWGVVLAVAPDEDAVVTAELDRSRITRVRESVPSLANRQPQTYRGPTAV
jgi:deaminated glutathione amidase